ncbi:MAG: hypothetical protein LRY56_02860 [Burkholderiaceae bacterium]|nr:hypothetical protein [Burkholderiaceae bacterium]MCD8536494.1 hypothetical protein [Burkholderiaceae bacterium]
MHELPTAPLALRHRGRYGGAVDNSEPALGLRGPSRADGIKVPKGGWSR